MFASLCILGRQPALGLAELETLYGADSIKPVGTQSALVDIAPAKINHARLGGTIKVCKVLTEIPSTDWNDITEYLVEHVPKHVCCLTPGKVKFGISVHDLKASTKAINATGLSIKKASKSVERSMRVVPNKEPTLNAAQILNNKMTDELGMELVLVREGSKTILAQTTSVQDIDAYAARDQERPARDARVGMLPPKLAQTIINLACPNTNRDVATILDPFCGTGVVLQEALLMGFNVVGSDIDQRMAQYTDTNIRWLIEQTRYNLHIESYRELSVTDATKIVITDLVSIADNHLYIACETYLGRPFSTEPNPDKLREVIHDVDTIHRKFLTNVAHQTKPGFRMCIAVPAWHTKNGVKHLPMLDHLTDMGYTRICFVHSKNKDLVYHRDNQIVGRELVVLIRK